MLAQSCRGRIGTDVVAVVSRGERRAGSWAQKTKAPLPITGHGALSGRLRESYFATGAVVASFFTLALFLTLVECFLVLTAVLPVAVVVVAAGAAGVWAGAWFAANIGTDATAKAMARMLFFIYVSPLRV